MKFLLEKFLNQPLRNQPLRNQPFRKVEPNIPFKKVLAQKHPI